MNNSRTHSAVQGSVPLPAWGNQSSDRLSYDGAGRIITKRYLAGGINGATHAYNDTTALVGATSGYDRSGNKLYERHLEAESRSHLYQPFNNDGSFGVGYDSANRLLQYQRGILSGDSIPYLVDPGASIDTPTTLPGADQLRTYGLDGLGNWKTSNFTLVGSGGGTSNTAEVRQHNYLNEITSVRDTTSGTPTTKGFTYDKNGNLLNDGVRTYQYDALNRLIQVSKVAGGAVIASYVYDALGRRIQKTINDLGGGNGGLTGDILAGTTDYLYDAQQIVEERNDAAPTVWTKVNFWGQYIDELMFFAVPTESAPTTYRVLSDLLYRSVAIVTTSNTVIEAYDCDAYGNTLCFSGPGGDGLWFTDDDVRTNNPINTTIFTGRQLDAESQIYYYRARYYNPVIGRFISRDPIGIKGGINLYEYVGSSPVNAFDPLGLIIEMHCNRCKNNTNGPMSCRLYKDGSPYGDPFPTNQNGTAGKGGIPSGNYDIQPKPASQMNNGNQGQTGNVSNGPITGPGGTEWPQNTPSVTAPGSNTPGSVGGGRGMVRIHPPGSGPGDSTGCITTGQCGNIQNDMMAQGGHMSLSINDVCCGTGGTPPSP